MRNDKEIFPHDSQNLKCCKSLNLEIRKPIIILVISTDLRVSVSVTARPLTSRSSKTKYYHVVVSKNFFAGNFLVRN